MSYRMQSDSYRRNTLVAADRMRRSLLSEASLLDSLGNPLGSDLRSIALKLPLTSLDRIERGS